MGGGIGLRISRGVRKLARTPELSEKKEGTHVGTRQNARAQS